MHSKRVNSMFCIKCGRKINADKCEYCGSANTIRSNNNYFKSSEMYELLNEKPDFRYSEVNEGKYVSEEKLCESKADMQLSSQAPENAVSDDINENKIVIQRSTASSKIKNVIIAFLCTAVVCVSAFYAMLLNKYNNIIEKNSNIEKNNAADRTENCETETTTIDNTYSEGSSTYIAMETTENDASMDNTDIEVKIKLRAQKAKSLNNFVNANKYDIDQYEQVLALYRDKQPIMQFDEYDYSSNYAEYDIEYAEKCLNTEDVNWDNTVSCGKLFYINSDGNKKFMYYFMEPKTYGKQYILADEDCVPDIDDIIYVEPIDISEKNFYYMARYCNKNSSMYIVIDNKVYDYIQLKYDPNNSISEVVQ